jgi:hypothetical protein
MGIAASRVGIAALLLESGCVPAAAGVPGLRGNSSIVEAIPSNTSYDGISRDMSTSQALQEEDLRPYADKCALTPDAAISGYNRQHLAAQTRESCEAECLSKSWCNSFDWHKRNEACDLSAVSSQDVENGLKRNYAGNPYDHYDCTGHCTVTRNAAISGHNRQNLKEVTVSDCEKACRSRSWCKSFDWYKHENKCDLSDKSAQDGPLKWDYAGHPYDHYGCREASA